MHFIYKWRKKFFAPARNGVGVSGDQLLPSEAERASSRSAPFSSRALSIMLPSGSAAACSSLALRLSGLGTGDEENSQLRPAENKSVFSTLPICLSRACLGKLIVLNTNGSTRRFHTARVAPDHHRLKPRATPGRTPRRHQQPSACSLDPGRWSRIQSQVSSLNHGSCEVHHRPKCDTCTKHLLSKRFLCLSRACLGKMIILSINQMAQKRAFPHRSLSS